MTLTLLIFVVSQIDVQVGKITISLFVTCDRLGITGSQTYAVRELNVVSERLFIQPMLWVNWLYIL